MILTVKDIELYSYCPRLKWYYTQAKLDTNQWHRDIVTELCKWLYTNTLRMGSFPTYIRLDEHWRKLATVEDKTEASNTLATIRIFMNKYMQDYAPVYTNFPIRFAFKNVIIEDFIPLLALNNKRQPVAVYFSSIEPALYRRDWHIRLCSYIIKHRFGIEEFIVFRLNTTTQRVTKHGFNLDAVDESLLEQNIKYISKALTHGPFHPILNCKRRSCIHWNECSL